MKKIIILLSSLLIFIFINLNITYAFNNRSSTNYNNISNDNYTLIVKILKDANKEELIPYANLINLKTISFIPNDKNSKIAYTLSLPQQSSFIALYKSDNNSLKFEGLVDNLSNIENFYYYKNFIVVEQYDSTYLTNFTQREFIEVFFNKNNKYISVFDKNIYIEKIIKNSDNEIKKDINTASIDFLENDLPTIICINSITSYNGIFINLTNSYEFIEDNKSTKKEIYEWNPEIECFILKKNS